MSWLPSNEQYFAKKDRYYKWLTGRAMAGERWMIPTHNEIQEMLQRSNKWDEDESGEDKSAESDQSQQAAEGGSGGSDQKTDESDQKTTESDQKTTESDQKTTESDQKTTESDQHSESSALDILQQRSLTRTQGTPTSHTPATSSETPEQASKRRFDAMIQGARVKGYAINEHQKQQILDKWNKADVNGRQMMEKRWADKPVVTQRTPDAPSAQ